MTMELLRRQTNHPFRTETVKILPEDCSLFERIKREERWQVAGGYCGSGKQLFLDCLEAANKSLPEDILPKPNEGPLSYTDRLFNLLVHLTEQRIERMKLDNFNEEEEEQEYERRRLMGIILSVKIYADPLGTQN